MSHLLPTLEEFTVWWVSSPTVGYLSCSFWTWKGRVNLKKEHTHTHTLLSFQVGTELFKTRENVSMGMCEFVCVIVSVFSIEV